MTYGGATIAGLWRVQHAVATWTHTPVTRPARVWRRHNSAV